jgi:hypothetical protein
MWRPIVTIVAVVVIDIVIAFFALLSMPQHFNMMQMTRAYEKLSDRPSVENAQAITTLQAEADTYQLKFYGAVGLSILVITALGFFAAGRQSKRVVTPSSAVTSST